MTDIAVRFNETVAVPHTNSGNGGCLWYVKVKHNISFATPRPERELQSSIGVPFQE